jgi:hypothetical protein
MAGFQRKIPDNEILRNVGAPLLPATLGETIDAAFTDPRNAPFGQAVTQGRVRREQGRGATPFPGPPRPGNERMEPADGDLSEMVPAEQLNEQYGELGMNFDRPMRRDAARILAEQKREDLIRQDVIARGPEGVTAGALQIGASFVRSIMDPINIASAFVPAVGQARYAGMVARMGRTRARLATGAAEGTIGAAATEPLTLSLSRQQQLDYSMADALANVAFGGILGGGVQAVGGKVGDFLQARSRRAREEAMRSAIAQASRGKQVDVGPVLAADALQNPRIRGAERQGATSRPRAERPVDLDIDQDIVTARGQVEGIDEALDALRADVAGRGARKPQSLVRFLQASGGLRDQGGELSAGLGITGRTRPGLVNNRSGLTLDDAALRATEAGFLGTGQGLGPQTGGGDARAGIDDLLEALDQEINRGRKRFAGQTEGAEAVPDDVLRNVQEQLDRAGIDLQRTTNRQIKDILAVEEVAPDTFTATEASDVVRRAQAAVAAYRDASYDLESSTQAQQILDRAPQQFDETAAQEDIAYVQQLVDDYRAQGLLSEADENLIAEADEIVNRSDQLGQAAREAATCMTRRA